MLCLFFLFFVLVEIVSDLLVSRFLCRVCSVVDALEILVKLLRHVHNSFEMFNLELDHIRPFASGLIVGEGDGGLETCPFVSTESTLWGRRRTVSNFSSV